ncbi:MAG TPA: hypothetical protein PKK26_14680 [Candidatus Wallbacteria bacterium]|nr:hypothetical protein [Candidatus Wallbacteria bacterium]
MRDNPKNFKKNAYSLIELLMYLALLGVVMSFVIMIFRQMTWRDRLEGYAEDNVRIKAVMDKVTDSVKNAVEIIKPAPGKISNRLIVMRDDGTYEKLGIYNVGGKPKFTLTRNKSIEKLDVNNDEERESNVFSNFATSFYVARPFYNHALIKVSTPKNSMVTAASAELLKYPKNVQITKYFSSDFRKNFIHDNLAVNVTADFRQKYSEIKKGFEDVVLNEKNIRKFMENFDKYSKSQNFLKSRAMLKEFISDRHTTDIGKIIFYTADIIEKCSAEISLSSKISTLSFEPGTPGNYAEEIFGRELIGEYKAFMVKIAKSSNHPSLFTIRPDCQSLTYEIIRVCNANKNTLIDNMSLATPYTGELLDDNGSPISVININYGKTVPISINDVNIYSDIEKCPPFSSPDTRFSSIYEVIDSKLPFLSNDQTFAQNLETLYYGVKKVKKVTIYGSNIDIFDFDVKFPIKISMRGIEYDLAFFVRMAQEMAQTEFPDLSRSTPIPTSIK